MNLKIRQLIEKFINLENLQILIALLGKLKQSYLNWKETSKKGTTWFKI